MKRVTYFIFLGSKITVDDYCSLETKRCLLLGRKAVICLDSILKIRDITLPTKVHLVKGMVFPLVMDGYDSWTIKKAECKELMLWTVVRQKTLENPLVCKEIKSVNSIGDQFQIFIGRTDAEAEAPILWPPDAKSQFIRKYSDARKDWRQEEKAMTEYETVGWHHQLNGHEFERALAGGVGQGSLTWCSLWGHEESDMTELMNNNNNKFFHFSRMLESYTT